jgi:hypothetical protein
LTGRGKWTCGCGRAAIDGIVEVFNLLNHEHYGSFVANASNAQHSRLTTAEFAATLANSGLDGSLEILLR